MNTIEARIIVRVIERHKAANRTLRAALLCHVPAYTARAERKRIDALRLTVLALAPEMRA